MPTGGDVPHLVVGLAVSTSGLSPRLTLLARHIEQSSCHSGAQCLPHILAMASWPLGVR